VIAGLEGCGRNRRRKARGPCAQLTATSPSYNIGKRYSLGVARLLGRKPLRSSKSRLGDLLYGARAEFVLGERL